MYLLPPIGEPDPAAVMPTFLQQARAAGVRRAVRPPRDRALHTARPDDGYFEGLPVATQYFRIQKRY